MDVFFFITFEYFDEEGNLLEKREIQVSEFECFIEDCDLPEKCSYIKIEGHRNDCVQY
jgi:hypothetical protein